MKTSSVEQFKNNSARLVCVTNASRFRKGDLVVLYRGHSHDEDTHHYELQYDGELDRFSSGTTPVI